MATTDSPAPAAAAPQAAPQAPPAPTVQGLAADLATATASLTTVRTQKAELRQALHGWLSVHGERCPCARCIATRKLLDTTA